MIGVLSIVLGSSLVAVTPRPAAAIPTVTLTLSLKPAWIEFGGTFTLTATITPSGPVAGIVRLVIRAENSGPAFGHMHGCTPACSLDVQGEADFDLDGLAARTTVKALWTDDGMSSTRNRFIVGVATGDVNIYNPPDWIAGYIGSPPPTATPKPTKRPTAAPTARSTPAAVATATILPTQVAQATSAPAASIAPPASTPSAAPVPTSRQSVPAPTEAPAVADAATIAPIVVPSIAFVILVGVVLLALRSRRPSRDTG